MIILSSQLTIILNTIRYWVFQSSDTLQLSREPRHLEESLKIGVEGLGVLHETVKS